MAIAEVEPVMMGTTGTFDISTLVRRNGVDRSVTGAIQQASAKTGVDFGYLVRQANVESSMNPNAKARTSSATGLYQFIEQTWLQMVKSHGAKHGYGKFADAIRQKNNGEYYVADRSQRNAILNLRKDPKAASLMAAELATENNAYLEQRVGRSASQTDLYMAHFLGANGASNFLNAMRKNPWAPAASLFPEAARSNRAVFYQNGKPLSLQQVYNRFDEKFQGGSNAPIQSAVASADQVVLPQANDWSNPTNSVAAARMANEAQFGGAPSSGLRVFSSQDTAQNTARSSDTPFSGFGQMLRTPVDVLFLAQETIGDGMRFAHNDRGRYNA